MPDVTQPGPAGTQSQTSIDHDRAIAQARDALQYAEDIILTLREPFLVLDRTLRVTNANEAFYTTFKVAPEDTLGQQIYELGNGQWDISRLHDLLMSVVDRNASFEGEEVVHDFPSIGRRTMVLNARRLRRDHLPEPRDRVLLAIEDVTDRKRAEEELRLSEQRFRALVSATTYAVYRMSPEWDEMRELQGRDFVVDTEKPSRDWLETYIDPLDRSLVLSEIEKAVRSKSVFSLEHRIRRPDGSLRWTHSLAVPILDPNGEIVEWFGATSDITERKQADAALRASREHLKRVLETDAVGILLFETNTGLLVDANDAFLAMTGYTREQVFSRALDWRAMTPAEHVAESERQMSRLRRTGRLGPYQKEYLTADGSRRWMLFSGSDLGDGTVVEFAIDITEQEELRESGRRKDEFLAMLAHELRNPLAAMSAAVELLEPGAIEPAAHEEVLAILRHQMTNVTRMVDDLLDVSRVTRGAIQLHRSVLDVNAVVQRAVEVVREEIRARRQKLALKLPEDPEWVSGDAARLEQVYVNLLTNATRYTPDGGAIDVVVEHADNSAVVRVRDTGTGLHPSMLSRIFELFWQAEQGLDRRQGGLGLGLPLVKSLVELHGGAVTAASDGPGMGSEFVIRLPAVSPAARAPAHSAMPGAAPPASRTKPPLRVLIVDDNEQVRRAFVMLLRRWGYEARTASSGPEALHLLPEFRPDVVLLDIGLPGMDGFEVARCVRADPALSDVMIVGLTGYGAPTDRLRSRQAGFDSHLLKPPDMNELQRILEAAARRR